MPGVVFQILPPLLELYPDSPELALGPLGVPVNICAYSSYVICLGIFLVVRLGLGMHC